MNKKERKIDLRNEKKKKEEEETRKRRNKKSEIALSDKHRSLGIFDRGRTSTISRRWMAPRSSITSPSKRNKIVRVGESMKQVLNPFFSNREPHAAAI